MKNTPVVKDSIPLYLAASAVRYAERQVRRRYGREAQLVLEGERAALVRHGVELSGGVLLQGPRHPNADVDRLFRQARAWMTVLRWGAGRCQGCGVMLPCDGALAVCPSCESWERLAWEEEGLGHEYRPARRRPAALKVVEDHHQAAEDAQREERVPATVGELVASWTSFHRAHLAGLPVDFEDYDGRYLTVRWRRPAGGAKRITVAILDGDTVEDVAATLRRHLAAAGGAR